jgi:uncharacterized protein YjiS (DUF1127 family)
MKMFSCTRESMINHHGSGFLADLRETLHVWRERHDQRHQLAELSERDLHDVGLSWSEAVFEAEKPFGGRERRRAGVAS